MQGQIYDFSLGAGGAQKISVVGSSVKLLEATGPIELRTDTGVRVPLLPGQGFKGIDFGYLTLVDKSAVSNGGKLLVISGEMTDNRVTGEVSVIDGGKARVMQGDSIFACMPFGYTPNIGWYSTVVIFNEPSAKKFVVNQIVMQGVVNSRGESVGGCVLLKSALATDLSALEQIGTTITSQGSKRAGDTRSGVTAYGGCSQVKNPIGANLGGQYYVSPVGQPVFLKMTEPIVLLSGRGIALCALEANMAFSVAVEGYYLNE